MIYYTSRGPDYFFSLSVPFLRRPRSHTRLSSVPMNADIGHRLRPIAFAIRASLSLSPSFFPPSAADAPCLACSRASAERAKVTLMKSEAAFFPLLFVCLFVCALRLPVPPSPAYFLLPRDSFSFPRLPPPADAIKRGICKFQALGNRQGA